MNSITLPYAPIPMGRPRAAYAKPPRMYTPKRSREYLEKIAADLRDSDLKRFGKGVAVQVSIRFDMPHKVKSGAHVSKPDGDNLEKMVLDAIVRAGILFDDSQVVSLSWSKMYGREGCTKITIAEVDFSCGGQ